MYCTVFVYCNEQHQTPLEETKLPLNIQYTTTISFPPYKTSIDILGDRADNVWKVKLCVLELGVQ